MKKALKLLIAIIVCISVSYQCKSYKRVYQTRAEFSSNKPVQDAFSQYNVYVYDKTNIYRLRNPAIAGDAIKGKLEAIKPGEKVSGIDSIETEKQKRKHKYDLNIYTDKNLLQTETASTDSVKYFAEGNIELKKEEIKKVSLYAIDKKKSFSTGAKVGLGIVVLLLIVLGLILLIASATKSAGTASGNASGNSSNQSSAGSNSGNSSGKGSGCYVATMVYGDYDAPEVMTLRKFRDEILSKSACGRTFIKYYYKYSPLFVERFKENKSINNTIKYFLDRFVKYLSKKNW
jgi:hypothetical protein